jgi:hypothetical protein
VRPPPALIRLAAVLTLSALVATLNPADHVGASVFYSKDEAFALVFPESTAVEPVTAFLTDAQVAAVKQRTGVALESQLFTYYVGRTGDDVLGYAVIETHIVRTLPETFLVVLTPGGTLDRVILLAFYEPPEYMPPQRWLTQFTGRDLEGSGWRLGRDLHGITGATLTARAVPQALRKILILYELVMRPPRPR